MKKIIEQIIKLFTGGDIKTTAFSNNQKIENKIENSTINAPVQQAHTVLNKIDSNQIISQSSKISATKLSHNVYSNFDCKNCGTIIGLLVGSSSCPGCGLKIE